MSPLVAYAFVETKDGVPGVGVGVGLGLGLGLGEGEGEGLGLGEGEGVGFAGGTAGTNGPCGAGEGEGLGLGLGLGEGEGEVLGLGEGEGEVLGLGLDEGSGLGEGETMTVGGFSTPGGSGRPPPPPARGTRELSRIHNAPATPNMKVAAVVPAPEGLKLILFFPVFSLMGKISEPFVLCSKLSTLSVPFPVLIRTYEKTCKLINSYTLYIIILADLRVNKKLAPFRRIDPFFAPGTAKACPGH